MTLAALIRVGEAAREMEHLRLVLPLEARLEAGMVRAFRAQERRFMAGFKRLKPRWSEPVLQESLGPADWEPFFAVAVTATSRLFLAPMMVAARAALLAGAKVAIADLAVELSFSLENPRAVAYLREVPNRVAGINATTRSEIQSILTRAADEGWSYNRTAKELQQRFEGFRKPATQKAIRTRAHLIAVTEVGDAYAAGNMALGRELRDQGLGMEKRALTAGDERTCPICTGNEADGWIPLDQLFSSGHDAPTFHPACVVGETLVLASGATAVTKRWHEGDFVVIRTASGNELTCTPNHPILTPRGWVAAEILHEGDDVISDGRRKGPAGIDDDHEDVPTAIHEVAEAFRRSPGVAAAEVPLTTEHFHGDGKEGEVAVVWTNRLLRDRVEATRLQCGHDLPLYRRNVVQCSLAAEGSFAKGVKGLLASEAGGVGCFGIAPVLVGSPGRHHQAISGTYRPALNPLLNESPLDRVAVYAALLSERILGTSAPVLADKPIPVDDGALMAALGDGRATRNTSSPKAREHSRGTDAGFVGDLLGRDSSLVFTDEIVHVERRFGGHVVYNLEMPNGWYVANGIITHNCRCDVMQKVVV